MEQIVDLEPEYQDIDERSMLALASFLLRWRRTIIAFALGGLLIGLATALLARRVYMSSATFIPEASEGRVSGLALAASQFGISIPGSGNGWGPPIYVELLRSRALLEAIASDSVVLTEEGKRRVAVIDLLNVRAPTKADRLDRAVRELRKITDASEDKKLGAVKVSATTRWPSLSLALTKMLVNGVNRFNLETRKTQAAAERQFVETQAAESELALREAEDRLQQFLQQNRVAGSPQLAFERDRLQRTVDLRQQVYTSLVTNREEARIREVRDTPVITVLEDPKLPAVSESRKLLLKGVLGGVGGAMLGMLTAFVAQGLIGARHKPTDESRQFFSLVEEATPKFLRRVVR
jgi:uncharacterized protein involved in exopolysaccharide biosynthesis